MIMENPLPPGLKDLLELHQNCFATEAEPPPPADLISTGKQLDDLKRRRNLEYIHFLKDFCVPLWRRCQNSDLTDDDLEESAIDVNNKIKKLQDDFRKLYKSFQPDRSSSSKEYPTGTKKSDKCGTETKSELYFPCIFYPCFWFPDTGTFTSKIDVLSSKVKINDTTVEFQEGTVRYLERYYSNGEGVYRVPPVMFHNDRFEVKEPKDKSQETAKVKKGKLCQFQQGKKDLVKTVEPLTGISEFGRELVQSRTDSELQSLCEPSLDDGETMNSVFPTSLGVKESSQGWKARSDLCEESKECASAQPKRREKSDRKPKKTFVTKISLMTDYDVINKNHEELKKLSENQRKEILRQRKSQRAVDHVAHNFEIFARREKLNAIILTDFKYKSYLQNVLLEEDQFVSNISGDHDLIFICREFGIMFIQIKSNIPENTTTISKDICHALRQLLSDKYTFWQSNRDLPFIEHLPLYCFIAVPFLTDSCLNQFNICPSHKMLIMSNSVLESSKSLSSWIKDKIRIPRDPVFEVDQYRVLIARYIGQGSIKVLPNPVRKTFEQIDRAGKINTHQDRIFLNPEQHAILQEPVNKLQMIAGNYGTGKTLLLAILANKIRKNNSNAKIHCITCTDISKEGLCNPSSPFQASHQMNDLLRNATRANVFGDVYKSANSSQKVPPFIFVTGEVFFDTLSKMMKLSSSEDEQHFLVDEAPLVLFERREDSNGPLDKFLESLNPKTHVWITIASHTYKVDVGKGEDPAEKARVNMHPSFNFCYLKYTMRVSKRLFKMVQEVEAFTQDGHHRFSECGHVIDGPMPRLYTLASCKCESDTREVGKLPCDCSKERLIHAFEKIFYFVKANHKSDIIVLIEYGVQGAFFTKLCEIVDEVLKNKKKMWLLAFKSKVDDQGGQSSSEDCKEVITVADGRTFRGCENRIVIVVDPYRMNQWFRTHGHVGVPTMVLTRCLGQYIHVTWPDEESWIMCSRVLDEYDDLIGKYRFMPKSWQDHMKEFVRQARLSPRGTLITTLVENDLLLHCGN